jgi:aminocarboxymuconate-semialdehyde decarboxylase
MSSEQRIDVHTHVIPPFWAQELPNHGGDASGTVIPDWTPDRAIAFMDAHGIATSILSLTAPSVAAWPKLKRRTMARRVNEYTAGLVAKRPDRFGHFATLTLPDVDGAHAELEYVLDTLHADGVILLSNYAGKYLGDPAFDSLWSELSRREAVVFIHPGLPKISHASGVAGPLVDYPFDTTRSATQLVLNGVVNRYPKARIILSHAGGFLPYISHRIAELSYVFRPEVPRPSEILADLQRFYFDTALSSSPAALPSLIAFAGRERILYGSDFPYAPEPVGAAFNKKLDVYEGLSDDEQSAIAYRNALPLFPRLAPLANTETKKQVQLDSGHDGLHQVVTGTARRLR